VYEKQELPIKFQGPGQDGLISTDCDYFVLCEAILLLIKLLCKR